MPFPYFDRKRLKTYPLSRRRNRVIIERDYVRSSAPLPALSVKNRAIILETAERIRRARKQGKPVIMTFGAHLIKNGLGPVLISLMKDGWLTHLATNGAGVIHDWEFAFQGASSEQVHANMMKGRFGHWEETGFYINLALAVGAHEGLGYGESIGALIANDGLTLPLPKNLQKLIVTRARTDPEKAAAAADLLAVMRQFKLKGGQLAIAHPYKRYSIQAAAFHTRVPFTAHPMFGQDIIYTHPLNRGAIIGRTAERDFLSFADSISRIDNGVYISVGSAVMSPMIFEKAFAMAQNLALQKGHKIDRHYILAVDLMKSDWNWQKGEPPEENPAYYLRFCKTFNRVGGTMRYLQAHNRDFLLALAKELNPEMNIKLIPIHSPQDVIRRVRGHAVILDSDLAALYSVTVKRLNQQITRNRDRFPEDFCFQLTEQEWRSLRLQNATLKRGQHRKYMPHVFTEHGATRHVLDSFSFLECF